MESTELLNKLNTQTIADPQNREAFFELLGFTDQFAQERLKTILRQLLEEDSDDAKARSSAITGLAYLKDQQDFELVARFLRDPDNFVRLMAFDGLIHLDQARALATFIQILQTDSDPGIRNHSACYLGDIKDKRSLEALLKAFNLDKTLEIRASAAYGLGNLGYVEAVAPLIEALTIYKDAIPDNATVRSDIVRALGKLGTEQAIQTIKDLAQTETNKSVKLAIRKVLARPKYQKG